MKELHYFKDSGNPEINVAIAGIHKDDWKFSGPGESLDTSINKMSSNRFDVLPIMEVGGEIQNCYKTKNWGNYVKDNIEVYEIASEDRMYYLTHIHDAIIKFAKTNRKFFFLDNQMEIIGLITIGNLNCKHVYLYLYNLVIQVEHAMGAYIYSNGIKDGELIQLFESRSESRNAKDALMRYQEDDEKGFDYDFVEYLYLTDLCYVFKKKGFIEKINMANKEFMSITRIFKIV